MTPLEAIEAHLTAELERLRAGGEKCDGCLGKGYRNYWSANTPCPDCNGSGRSPAITTAEEALKLCREERKRVERLLGRLAAIEKILDDHTDYEGPMPETGDYVGGVDPGALDLIVDLLRPKGGRSYGD